MDLGVGDDCVIVIKSIKGDIFEIFLKNVTFLFLLLPVFCDIQVETNENGKRRI